MKLLLVGSGGFAGAVCRYKLAGWIHARYASAFPYGTLTVNLLGSFLLGYLAGHVSAETFVLWMGTGFIGAFTTFSTLKLESIKLLKQRLMLVWLLYTGVTYTFGILLAYAGYHI
ncbi:protein CrcB [Paenibacillus sp. N10]|uniref:Fluoride-specific ion channel FluC n=1 Tax=Paenibacillus lutrae TaxID=2078573 RepID=A0A7X3FGL8_9BACL|nr:protein CrcB [Paenibacillus lutrae]